MLHLLWETEQILALPNSFRDVVTFSSLKKEVIPVALSSQHLAGEGRKLNLPQ